MLNPLRQVAVVRHIDRRPAPTSSGSLRAWEEPGRRSTLIDGAFVLGLATAALGVGLFRLGNASLWADELFTSQFTAIPFGEFWRYFWQREGNMLLYYLLLRGWLWLTSHLGLDPSELVLRAPSVVFAVLAVVVVYWLGRRFWGRTVGALGAGLYIVNHVQLSVDREARSYSLEMLLTCLGWYALLVAIQGGSRRRRWWAVYAVAMTLALYSHLFSALVLAAQIVAFVALLRLPSSWQARVGRSIVGMAVSVGAIGVAMLPMVGYYLHHGSNNQWVPPANPTAMARLLWNISGHLILYGVLLGLSVLLALIVGLAVKRRYAEWHAAAVDPVTLALLCWMVVPVVLSYTLTQPLLNLHLFVWGYLVVVIPPLCLLAARGVTLLPWRRARPALALALVATAVAALPIYYGTVAQDYKTAVRWTERHYQPADGLVCTPWSCPMAFAYYLPLDRGPAPLAAGAPGTWSWQRMDAMPLDQRSLAVYARLHPRIFYVDALTMQDSLELRMRAQVAQEWLNRNYRMVAQITTHGPVTVRLYVANAMSADVP
ncbi:MAG: hypothetical protein E6I84_14535 [Chloroflexi bacterium]|nr:MAG: hypothetical protein E6I84_14535 [Chloroflexota bacterium]